MRAATASGLLALSWVFAFVSCGTQSERAADTGAAAVDISTESTAGSRASWRWQGLVVEPFDGAALACVGEIAPSDPPQCPSGWPLSGFDWADITWLESSPSSRSTAVQLVGHPDDGVFVLDEPPAPADPAWTPPPCELLDGRPGEAIMPSAMSALIQGPEPAQAGVWLTLGPGGIGCDLAVTGVISVALGFSTDEAIAWLVENLPGRRFQVCPQTYAANVPPSIYTTATTAPSTASTTPPTTIPSSTTPLPTVSASVAVLATTTTTTQP